MVGLKPGMQSAGRAAGSLGPFTTGIAITVAASNAFSSVAAPSGRQVGDRLICAAFQFGSGGGLAHGSGWSDVILNPAGGSNYKAAYFTRIADGTSADNYTPSGVTGTTSATCAGAIWSIGRAGSTLTAPATLTELISTVPGGAGSFFPAVTLGGTGFLIVPALLLVASTNPNWSSGTPGGLPVSMRKDSETLDGTGKALATLWVARTSLSAGSYSGSSAGMTNGSVTTVVGLGANLGLV